MSYKVYDVAVGPDVLLQFHDIESSHFENCEILRVSDMSVSHTALL